MISVTPSNIIIIIQVITLNEEDFTVIRCYGPSVAFKRYSLWLCSLFPLLSPISLLFAETLVGSLVHFEAIRHLGELLLVAELVQLGTVGCLHVIQTTVTVAT